MEQEYASARVLKITHGLKFGIVYCTCFNTHTHTHTHARAWNRDLHEEEKHGDLGDLGHTRRQMTPEKKKTGQTNSEQGWFFASPGICFAIAISWNVSRAISLSLFSRKISRFRSGNGWFHSLTRSLWVFNRDSREGTTRGSSYTKRDRLRRLNRATAARVILFVVLSSPQAA